MRKKSPQANSSTHQNPQDQVASVQQNAELDRIMHKVSQALQGGQDAQAIFLFNRFFDQWLEPHEVNPGKYLIHAMGKHATHKLLNAYAQLPCPCCQNGLVPCQECKSRDPDLVNAACQECLELKISKCLFCGGSGLGTLENVPGPLQLTILQIRSERAIGRINELLLKFPAFRNGEPAALAKNLAVYIVKLNTQLNILENSIVDANDVCPRGLSLEDRFIETLSEWVHASYSVESRIWTALKCLAESSWTAADACPEDSTLKKSFQIKATLYEGLHTARNLSGTLLEHHFLDEIKNKSIEQHN